MPHPARPSALPPPLPRLAPRAPQGPAAPALPAARPAAIDRYPVAFTGTGREYFRVWIVNLLLTVITLALYTPFARRRTAQYFFGHTVVAGTPLEFTASGKRMFKGFMVLAGLYLMLDVASKTGQQTLVTALMLCGFALTPFFWGSAMRFRLRNTRWRGVRLAFVPRWGQVYAASWPMLLLGTLWLAPLLTAAFWLEEQTSPEESVPGQQLLSTTFFDYHWLWFVLALLLVGSALLAGLAVQEFNYRRLLVQGTRVGKQPGRWQPRLSAFIRIWFLSALIGLGLFGAIWLSYGLIMWAMLEGSRGTSAILILGAILFMALIYLASTPAHAYHEARVFHMMWNEVGLGRIARARCSLSVRGYIGLRLKNALLTMLTLGLYRPFARVSEYRMKAESVTLYVKGGLEQIEGQLVREQGSLGDALADAAGLDII